MLTMSGRSFPYHKLKKLPPPEAGPATPPDALEQDHHQDPQQQQQQEPPPSAAAAIQESYHSYYRALSAAAVGRGRRHHHRGATAAAGPRRRRPRRLRISRLARALRRKAEAVGGSVRASVARVARRLLTEGRPYIGDLFAGNYMFMQVAPSPTMLDGGKGAAGGFAPFTDYYYAARARSKAPAPGAAAGVV
ncbi:hypothetical protein BS78_03G398700 [Paspalum vaginatum]|nr:hypothetical protein BS78_03G398700 [Paspalum vaginatum]